MKSWIAMLLAGWVGWIDTTKWDEVSYLPQDPQAVQASTDAQKPKLRDVLLGPRAKTWREVKEPQQPIPASRVGCRESAASTRC